MSAAEMEHANQFKHLSELVAAFQTPIVHPTKHVLMIFVEIHAMDVLRTQFAVLKIINRFVRVNKATMEIQKYNAFKLVAEQTMNVQQHILASIDNVCQPVRQTHAVTKLNAMASITLLFVNVHKVSMEIPRLVAMLSDAEKTTSAQRTQLVSMPNVSAPVNIRPFVNKMKFVAFIITNRNAVVRLERYWNEMEHADNMMTYAIVMQIVHHKRHVLTANASIHVMQHNHAA